MFQLLELIGSFFLNFLSSIGTLLSMFFECLGLLYTVNSLAPPFLVPIISGMIAVVIIMWLVNLL